MNGNANEQIEKCRGYFDKGKVANVEIKERGHY